MTEKLYNVLSICHHYVMSCKYWWDILQFFSRTDCQDILGKNCEKLQSKFVEITVQILWVPFFQIWCTTVSTCIWYRRFSVTPCMCMAYFFHFPAAAACRSLLVMVHWSLLVATRIGWSSNVALSDHMVWLHASTKKSHVSVAASFNSQSLLCHWTRNIEWADAQRTQTNNFRRQIGARLCRCCWSTTSPGSTVLRHRRRFRHRHRPIVVVVCTRSTWTSWLVQPLCRRLPGGRSPWRCVVLTDIAAYRLWVLLAVLALFAVPLAPPPLLLPCLYPFYLQDIIVYYVEKLHTVYLKLYKPKL